jgi:hypothetical protein
MSNFWTQNQDTMAQSRACFTLPSGSPLPRKRRQNDTSTDDDEGPAVKKPQHHKTEPSSSSTAVLATHSPALPVPALSPTPTSLSPTFSQLAVMTL